MSRSVIARPAALATSFIAVAFAFACSSGSSGNNVTCGPGTTLDGGTCFANAAPAPTGSSPTPTSDAAAPVDASLSNKDGSAPVDAAPPVAPAPTFGGVTSAAPAAVTALQITWAPAKDAVTPPELLRYNVYVATAAGKENFGVPQVTTPPGVTSVVLDTLQANTTYFVVVRALNQAKAEDKNTTETSAKTQADTTPPTFAGATSLTASPEGSIVVAWTAATDDLTPKAGITYIVFLGNTAGGEDLQTPSYVSDTGATSITINGLPLPGSAYYAVVRAEDAAGNLDTNTAEVTGKAGVDTVAPLFGGCASAVTLDSTDINLTWKAATDDTTPQSQIAYDVFQAKTPGGEDFTSPVATFTGVTIGLVTGLTQNSTYYFVCRAKDLSGNEDANKAERHAVTPLDLTPPTFAGATSVTNITASSVQLNWAAGSDPQTSTAQLLYDVFQASTSGQEVYTTPTVTSSPGATSATVTGLSPLATYFWVVRARDKAGNRDGNTNEVTASTGVSFSQNVVGIFAQHCAVSNCHVPPTPPEGQTLTPGAAYANIVNVSSGECPEPPGTLSPGCPQPYVRVAPGSPANSYLYLKITGVAPVLSPVMPLAVTGDHLSPSEISIIASWIQEGALQN